MKRSFSAAIVCEGKLLIVQRALSEDFLPGYWELPGGGAEPNELAKDALSREVYEETGITLQPEYMGQPYFHFSYDVTDETHFMCVSSTQSVRLNPIEHAACVWISDVSEIPEQTSHVLRQSIQLAIENMEK